MAILQYTNKSPVESSSTHDLDLALLGASDWINVRYHLETTGLLLGVFDSLTGGDMEIAAIKHNQVFNTGDSTTLFIPGTTSFGAIQLSRGLGNSNELYNWFASASSGDVIQARRNGSIVLNHYVKVDQDKWEYTPVVRWNFYNAWLTKIEGFSWNVYQDSGLAILTVTIQPETIERVDP